MTRIAHLSDLHFGRAREDLIAPLLDRINALAPDLVAISGDLTQRARPEQFAAARTFLDALRPATLVVPGNHDVPLYNPFLRWLMPWLRYSQWIGPELEPQYRDDSCIVVGVNTVDPYSLQRGLLTARASDRICTLFQNDGLPPWRIVVAHHPLEHQPGERKKLMRGANRALENLSGCGMDIVLSGHLHSWRAQSFATRPAGDSAIQVHAGTGLSTRLRGQANDFNLLALRPDEVEVTRYGVIDEGTTFEAIETRRFARPDAEGADARARRAAATAPGPQALRR